LTEAVCHCKRDQPPTEVPPLNEAPST